MFQEKGAVIQSNAFCTSSEHDHMYVRKNIKIGIRVLSNLPLQVSLHFNLIFFPFWFLVYISMLPEKFGSLNTLYKIILLIIFPLVNLIECIRLYIGYKGNLQEKIADLAGFWLLTFLLQTPLQMFLLLCSGVKPSALERIMQCIMCLFLLSQLLFGLFALRNSAKHSVLMFNLSSVPTTN